MHKSILLTILLLFASSANAYIDPSVSLLAMQSILSILGAIIFFVKHPIDAIKRIWQRIWRKK